MRVGLGGRNALFLLAAPAPASPAKRIRPSAIAQAAENPRCGRSPGATRAFGARARPEWPGESMMQPMKPMEPMKPMAEVESWWPGDLGRPASTGGQDGMRYAFFPEARRLAIEKEGVVTLYDSGAHRITGVSQGGGAGEAPVFSGEDGPVRIEDLHRLG
jgi:hypothetical protein